MPKCQICGEETDRLQPGPLEGPGECPKPHHYFFHGPKGGPPCVEKCVLCSDYLHRIRGSGRYTLVKPATIQDTSKYGTAWMPRIRTDKEEYAVYLRLAKEVTAELSGTFFIESIHTVAAGMLGQDLATAWLQDKGFPAKPNGTHFDKSPYDLDIGRYLYDVKVNTTKSTIVPPDWWNVIIREDQLFGRPTTHFMGAFYNHQTHTFWLNGWITKPHFLERAKIYKKGEYFDAAKKHEVKHDCRSVLVRELDGRVETAPW